MSGSSLPVSSASPAQVSHYIHGIYNTIKDKLQPQNVDGRFFDMTKPKSATQVITYNTDTQKFENLTLENGLYTAARLTYFIAVPFFATYFAWYSVGCMVVTGVLSAIAQFRGESQECKDLATLAMMHGAYTLYNVAISYLGAATLLYIPVIAAIYAAKPDLVLKAHNYLHSHRKPEAERDEILEHKLAELAKQEHAKQAVGADETNAVQPSPILAATQAYQQAFKTYRDGQNKEQKEGIVEGVIPGYIKHFMDTVMQKPVDPNAEQTAPVDNRGFLRRLFKMKPAHSSHSSHQSHTA